MESLAPLASAPGSPPRKRNSSNATLDSSSSSRGTGATVASNSSASSDSSASHASHGSVPHTISTGRRSVTVTTRCLALSLAAGALLAFAAGRGAAGRGTPASTGAAALPRPTVEAGKEVPATTFATRAFPHAGAATSSDVHLDRASAGAAAMDEDSSDDSSDDDAAAGEDLHLPAGQHLLVDLEHVDPAFLNSEVRLAEAMLELVNESRLTLLSYHCHGLVPSGVSCAGVLLESHVAFHTWPAAGVIVLDLFTCGAAPLIPVLPSIERLFGVPAAGGDAALAPSMVWSHKLRGFRDGFASGYKRHENPLEGDLGSDLLAAHDYVHKVPLASAETQFQHVDVYEAEGNPKLVAARARSLAGDASYEARHPELFAVEKTLHLDGVLQSTLHGDAAYHEALVHPALLSHPSPRRVAIVGGGEGATLREVLKHRTVTEVVMVEIDEELVGLCREHLSEWSDCSDSRGSDAASCFDDGRTTMRYMDAFAWFMDSFGEDNEDSEDSEDESEEERFDVIIMDALDPDQFVEIVGNLYKDNKFVGSLFNGLSEEGVFVIQMGMSAMNSDPAMDSGPSQDAQNMMNALQSVGFESIHMYDEGHSHFNDPWSYVVCFKDASARARWYASPAELELELHRRLHPTRSGAPPLRFFDGATMAGYQTPPKAAETVYCRMADTPWECEEYAGIDPALVNVPVSNLEARKSTVGENAGRGLFAARDIPEGSSLDLAGTAKAFYFLPSTWAIIAELVEDGAGHAKEALSSVHTFAHGYGSAYTLLGKTHYTVESSIMLFCNHGCNGTYSFGSEEGQELGLTETNVDLNRIPEALQDEEASVYSPLFERHLRQKLTFGVDTTLRDIRQGEEILCDYLEYVGTDLEDWREDVVGLREQCTGEAMGFIQGYEQHSA